MVCHTDDVTAVTTPLRRVVAFPAILLAVVLGAAFGLIGPARSAAASTSSPASESSRASTPLRAPKTSYPQDTKFFTDVAEADGALASYEQTQQNVALRALLTDGAAFCALLPRAGNLDEALVEEATGAKDTASETHLPLSVTTFNTIESVALLTLCPSEQRLLPVSVRTRIHTLERSLAKPSR